MNKYELLLYLSQIVVGLSSKLSLDSTKERKQHFVDS